MKLFTDNQDFYPTPEEVINTMMMGENFIGKTTVLRLIDGLAGTFFPGEKGGTVLVRGTDVFDLSPRDRTESGVEPYLMYLYSS